MKKPTAILKPNQKNDLAPAVSLSLTELIINTDFESEYNYAISTDHGSVIQKGRFFKKTELQLDAVSSSKLLQLDLFNSEHHFTYNFILHKNPSVE